MGEGLASTHNEGRSGDATGVPAHGEVLLYVQVLFPC